MDISECLWMLPIISFTVTVVGMFVVAVISLVVAEIFG